MVGMGRRGCDVHARGQARAASVHPGAPRRRRRARGRRAGRVRRSARARTGGRSRRWRPRCEAAVGAEHVSADALDRVVHARGKSLRDLVRQRAGELGRVPDLVVRPGSEEELAAVVRAALAADAVVIPFGGGSNISGSLEAPARGAPDGPLRRPRAALRGALDRSGGPARRGPGRRLRPAPGGAAQRPRLDHGPLPRQLHPLDARRLDRDALVRACSPTSTATSPT